MAHQCPIYRSALAVADALPSPLFRRTGRERPIPTHRTDAAPVLGFDGTHYALAMRAGRIGARTGRMLGATPHAASLFPADRMPRHRSVEIRDVDPPVQLAPLAEQDDEVAHDAVAAAWAWAEAKGLAFVPHTIVRRIAQRRGQRHVVHAQRMRDGLSDVVTEPDPRAAAVDAALDTMTPEALARVLPAAVASKVVKALDALRAAPVGSKARATAHVRMHRAARAAAEALEV